MVFCAACFSATIAAPPASASAEPPAHLQGQVKDVDAKLATARARNEALQAQVTQMEQQNAAQQKQLQQRDAQIAALQAKLRAAGVPASATSVDH
jgi:chromosome segregation ATPase